MAYCPNCGVELSPEASSCPLCGAPTSDRLPANPQHTDHLIDPEDREKLTSNERKTIAWEVVSVSLFICSVVVVAVNLLANRVISWSLYPLLSLALLWVFITSPLILYRKPALAVLTPALAIPAFLIGIDLVDGVFHWSLSLALPIALIAELSVAAAAFVSSRVKRRGINIVAFVLLAAAVLCIGVESTIALYLFKAISLRWSVIVALALVPVAGFLIYLHYRIVKKSNLRKMFRL